MSSLAWSVLIVAGVCHAAPEAGRIVGGSPTSIEEYPSIVQVDSLGIFTGVWSHSCAANILTSSYLLTAAHCFVGIFYSPEYRRVRAGTSYRNTGGQISNVAQEYIHPSYGQTGFDGDIAVIRLVEPLIFNPAVQQGTIIAQNYKLSDNSPVVHAGWGTTTQGGSPSPVLLDVKIYTINTDLCRQRYLELPQPGIVTENMICAGILDIGGKDACQGDSGGPLYFENLIVGIVSWGHGCANGTYPGVSTAVSSYTNWIVQTVTQ